MRKLKCMDVKLSINVVECDGQKLPRRMRQNVQLCPHSRNGKPRVGVMGSLCVADAVEVNQVSSVETKHLKTSCF